MRPALKRGIAPLCTLMVATMMSAAPADRTAVEGKRVFNGVIGALGGAEAIGKVTAVRYEVTVTGASPQGEVSVPGEITMTYPDKLVFATRSEKGTVERVLNGNKGIARLPGAVRALPEAAVKEFQEVFYHDFFYIAQHLDRYEIRSLGTTPVGDVEYLTLELRGPGQPFTLLVEPRSQLPFRARYVAEGQGGPVEISEEFSDYRKVDGVIMYFKTERLVGGKLASRFVVGSMAINPTLDERLYALE